MFWLLFVVVFSYLGATLPIWRYAQPVNYIGFWVMALTIVGGLLGAVLAVFVKPAAATFTLDAFKVFDAGVGGALQPLWPMLFVTIACGAISGWHALVSSVGTGGSWNTKPTRCRSARVRCSVKCCLRSLRCWQFR